MKKIFLFAMAALALVACGNKDKNEQTQSEPSAVTALSLSPQSDTLKVGETAQLTVSVTPSTATVTFASNKPNYVTVDATGLMTAVAEGAAIITATAGDKTAVCMVTVTGASSGPTMADYLKGSNYYVFAMDDNTFAKIQSKVAGDYRINGEYSGDGTIPQETTSVLEIWGNTFGGGTGGGLNSFGEAQGYISLVTQTGDWAGNGCGGLRQVHRTVDFTGIDGTYKLVISYKTPAGNANTDVAKFTLYSTTPIGAEVPKTAAGNTNGEWKALEYPMSDFFNAGLDWSSTFIDGTTKKGTENMAYYSMGILLEGGIGQGLDVDAAFVYKP